MKNIQPNKLFFGLALLSTLLVSGFAAIPAQAATNKCGDVKTFFNLTDICAGTDKDASDEKSPIIAIALGILNFMAFGVSLVVAGGIVYGGIMYASARDNSSQTQKAMTIIVDSVTGLIAFFFLWAIINFLVPGGLF